MNPSRFSEPARVLLRVVAGALILQHGGQKLFGWFGGTPVTLMSQMGLAGVIEFFGGIAVAIGVLTRPAAFLLSGELAVAYFQAHQPKGALPIQNKGELAVLYSFVFLFFAAWGAGGFSIDGLRKQPRQ